MAIVLRFITDNWLIKQSVCRLMLLAKSMTGEEVARQIIMVLSTELGISSNLLVGAMRDRASVNEVAMRTVKVIYNQVINIGCFSHTLDHVGEHMRHPPLIGFLGLGQVYFRVVRKPAFCGRARLDCLVHPTLVRDGGVYLKLFIICSFRLEI